MKILNKIYELPWHKEKRWKVRHLSKIDKIIVHQEMGESDIEAVNNYHINKNHISKTGCPHFCYHFGIEKDGTIIQANEFEHVTWHTKGQNDSAIGIMLVGNFDGVNYKGKGNPTVEQLSSLSHLCDILINHTPMLKLNKKDVYGHIDYGKMACPGYDVYTWISNYRK